MMGLPDADYRFLRDLAIYMSKPTHPKSPAAWAEISAYLRGWIAKRRLEPGTDLISTILQSKVDDRPLTGDEAFSLCLLMLGGGLDTMVSMTTFIACFLAQNPAHRQELRGHPEKIDVAVEEFARRFGTSNLGRNIVQPTDLCGQTLLAGDIIVIPNPLFGLDETQNENPLNVDFNRAPPRHAAFGNGVHTCPGAVLARREIKIFLQEWLTRIPEFSIKPGTRPKVTTGLVNAMGELHLVWPV
jgi:cytochrome P450